MIQEPEGQYYACILKLDNFDLSVELYDQFLTFFQMDEHTLERGVGYDRYGVKTFFIKSKTQIDQEKIKGFELFLKTNRIKVLFKKLGITGESLFVKVFAVNLKLDLFETLRTLLVIKVENIIGKKIDRHDHLYCLHLSPKDPNFEKKKFVLKKIISGSMIQEISGFER